MLEIAITHQQGDFTLSVDINAPGGVTALFGRSGAGKTTIVNAIAGLMRPDKGRIVVNGQVLCDTERGIWLPPHKRRIGYVFQDARLFPHMTVSQNLHYGGQHDAARIIVTLGLEHLLDRQPNRLSGGERQRVALGRALMCNPQLLLMDEPLAALDAPRKGEILPYLERLRDAANVPIVYVSHAIREVTRLATTLVVLRDGRVARIGALADVMSDPTSLGLLGRLDAGAVLQAKITAHDADDRLTIVDCDAGRLYLQGHIGTIGDVLRLRVPAQDIMLSLDPPDRLSALNALPVMITDIVSGEGAALAVGLQAGTDRLLAQVSRRSARELGLASGQCVHAIFKVSAATPDDTRDQT